MDLTGNFGGTTPGQPQAPSNQPAGSSSAPRHSTRAFLATYRSLRLLHGVRAFTHTGQPPVEVEAAVLKPSDQVAIFHEVAALPEGSWWLPGSPMAPTGGEWDGSRSVALVAPSGSNLMSGLQVPSGFLFWIPTQPLEPDFGLFTFIGAVPGVFPDEAPEAPGA